MTSFNFEKLNKFKEKFLREDSAVPGGFETVNSDSNGQARGLTTLYSPQSEPENDTSVGVRDVADTLAKMGRLTEEQLSMVRGQQLEGTADTADILLKLEFVNIEDILVAKAHMYGFEFRRIKPEDVDVAAFEKLEIEFILQNKILPIEIQGKVLTVATSEPENVFMLDEVKRKAALQLDVVVATSEDIEKACASLNEGSFDFCVDDLMQDISDLEVLEESVDETEDLEKMAGESPVIKFVNYLISHAIRTGASDIHIEPKCKDIKIRYRIDGALFEEMAPPTHMHPAIVSRLKIMSNLDISERRLPQDGKIAVNVGGRGIDLRVSILPTTHGEKVVVRVLDSQSISGGLERSGMSDELKEAFKDQIKEPNGILLVTGPTGSGKSTTLYSALGQVDGTSLNVSTVEDPVEYELDFANQVNVNDRIGMTFAGALRSLLRQDPDIIMVGEIRDGETARTAVQAALTGHLVLSTLHTNNAPSTITRLVNIGIEPYLIAASLNAVLAQRLIRRICPDCKERYNVPENLKKHIDDAGISPENIFIGRGCDNCRQSGYVGRIGIYEFMLIDDQMKAIINSDCSERRLASAFENSCAMSLYDDGMEKVRQGLTTIAEVLRVTESYKQNPGEDLADNS